MKKFVLLLLTLSMLLCLFACKKADKNSPITNDVMQNQKPTFDDADVSQFQNHSWPIDYHSISFDTKYDLVEWLNTAQFSGAKSDKFKNIYGDIASGKRNLYTAYKNGKEIETHSGYTCIVSSGNVEFMYTLKDDSAKGGLVQICLMFPDITMRGEADSMKVFKNTYPATDESICKVKTIKFMDKDRYVIDYPTYSHIFRSIFAYEDVLVEVKLYDKDDSIEEFLDGFELRPIELTAKKNNEPNGIKTPLRSERSFYYSFTNKRVTINNAAFAAMI